MANGSDITGWQAHRACMGRARADLCINSTFTPELYEDDFTAVNAIKLLQRAPEDKPWFLHVSFPGPHDPFLVTTEMRNAASDGRVWPEAQDRPAGGDGTPGGACAPVTNPTGTRTRCNYAAEIENLDRLFQEVLDQVEEQGQTEHTVVCIASDHGVSCFSRISLCHVCAALILLCCCRRCWVTTATRTSRSRGRAQRTYL